MGHFLSRFLGRSQSAQADYKTLSQSGNVFFTMFGAVALVGVVGAASMQVMKGPVRTMSEVTKRTMAENNMIASSRLALIAASNQADGGDCDTDGTVEPVPYVTGGSCNISLSGGGCLPPNLGAALADPWDTQYGYCVWDHGTVTSACGGANLLAGEASNTEYVMAIISAGPDRQFQTRCNAFPTANAINKPGSSDDLVLSYTYGEAQAASGGLWGTKIGAPDTAEISKSLEVQDSGGTAQFTLDRDTGNLQIGGEGSFPVVKTDNIQAMTGGGPVMMASDLGLGSGYLSGDGGAEGIQIDASGNVTTSGNTSVTGDLGVTGTSSLAALTASGLATLNGGFSGTNGTLSGTLGVTGNTSLGTVTASGLATLNGGFSGTNGTLSGTFGVTGNTNLSTLGTSGLATLDSLGVTNGASVGANLTVTGSATANGLNSLGNGDIDGNFNVDGDTTLETLTTGGLASLNSLGVTTDASIGGTLDMTSGRITNVLDPSNAQDAATKAYVDTTIATTTGPETDPQVDDIATSGKWCRTDGTAIQCDQDPPMPPPGDTIIDADSDTSIEVEVTPDEDTIRFYTGLSNVKTERMIIDNEAVKITSTPLRIVSVTGAAAPLIGGGATDTLNGMNCADNQIPQWDEGGTQWVCANQSGGSDDMGNHTATQNINANNNKMQNTTGVIFAGVAGNAPTR